DFEGNEAKLEVSVVDEVLREAAGERLLIPVAKTAASAPSVASGTVAAPASTRILERPDAAAKAVAQVTAGVLELPVTAKLGNFVRVDLGGGRPGWVDEHSV